MGKNVLGRPAVPVPEDVQKILSRERLAGAYGERPPYQRNDYLRWINQAKRPETRKKRLDQMLEELRSGGVYMGMAWGKGKPGAAGLPAKTEFKTIDAYIASFSGEARVALSEIRAVIRAAAPGAEERMSWQMPTFWQGENLIHFAAAKHHIGIYPGAEAVAAFAGKLADYPHSKGTIQSPSPNRFPIRLSLILPGSGLKQQRRLPDGQARRPGGGDQKKYVPRYNRR
jgi:uncharacterized protein YdhG (YjbR/CyaY superfamily)